MHVCCCNCDPWNDPPYTNCWWTWWTSEQQQQILQHLTDYHPRMYQVLYRCPINSHHNQHFTDMGDWMAHLQWECQNINNANIGDDEDNENDGDIEDSDNEDSYSEDSDEGQNDENNEDENEYEAEEDNEEDVVIPEYQQVLFQNMEMLEAQFQGEENNVEVNFYQGSDEEDAFDGEDAAELDTDQVEDSDDNN